MNNENLVVNSRLAEKALLNLYGIEGEAFPLAGEVDFNFKIKSSNETYYILKISRPGVSLAYLDFQQEILLHLESKAISSETPKVFLNKEGKNNSTSFIL